MTTLPSEPDDDLSEDRIKNILNILGKRYSPNPYDKSHRDIIIHNVEPMPNDPVHKVSTEYVDAEPERKELE